MLWRRSKKRNDEMAEIKRHLAMVYGHSRAIMTFSATMLSSMPPEQRETVAAVLKSYVGGSIAHRQLPPAMGTPEDAQAFRDIYSGTLQTIIELADERSQRGAKEAAEQVRRLTDATELDPSS